MNQATTQHVPDALPAYARAAGYTITPSGATWITTPPGVTWSATVKPVSPEDLEIIRLVRERDAQDTGERLDVDDLAREFGYTLERTLAELQAATQALAAACTDHALACTEPIA